MKITPEMRKSVPFQYAEAVLDGRIVTGKRIVQAVERFYRWIDEADERGFYLDHAAGMRIIKFFPACLNHTEGKLAGKPIVLAPFQQFTHYNVFAWKRKADGLRRVRTVYDKRAKKNAKSTEMAGVAVFCLSIDMEMGAQVYVGATKEDQARICWQAAANFVDSPMANPIMRHIGFYTQQRIVGFAPNKATMRPLGGDSKTQDGINAHLSIIDEYHAHATDGVKENLESSSVMRAQPIVWHITTAGTNVQSPCKRYEDSVLEVLEGRVEIDHLWVMIHDLDEGDDWEDESVWFKANPLLGQGLEIERIREEYINAKAQPSKIPNFKTKHLNMWVDAPTVWIPNEIWMANKHKLSKEAVLEKFRQFGGYAGTDLSTTKDITAHMLLSEPDNDGDRYLVPFLFCPKESIDRRSKEDRVPYRFWADEGFIIATTGNQVDYDIVEDKITETYHGYNIARVGMDQWQAVAVAQRLMASGVEVSFFGQSIPNLSFPTKEFERLVYNGNLKHDGNPVVAWMLAGCITIQDANGNFKVHKGKSNTNGRRVDAIPASITALGESLTGPGDSNESVYNNPDVPFVC